MTSTGNMVGLFAGIGGLELGLGSHGWKTELLCEIDAGAQAVLRTRFADVPLHSDVTRLRSLPQRTELVAAGFPCQDLSQAGRTAGITGSRSSLVDEVFRLVKRKQGPRWLVIENVPFMLQLARGSAMRHITDALEDLGYAWAYRVVDARAFGLPQRRQRVLMVACFTVLAGHWLDRPRCRAASTGPRAFAVWDGRSTRSRRSREGRLSVSPARRRCACRRVRSSRRALSMRNACRVSIRTGRHRPPRLLVFGRDIGGASSGTR